MQLWCCSWILGWVIATAYVVTPAVQTGECREIEVLPSHTKALSQSCNHCTHKTKTQEAHRGGSMCPLSGGLMSPLLFQL